MSIDRESDGGAKVADPPRAVDRGRGSVARETTASGAAWWLPIIPGIAALVVWEVSANWFFPQFLPRPSRVFLALPEVATNPEFWGSVASSMLAIVEGIIIGIALGVPVGLFLGRTAPARWFSERYLHALNAMPVVAIIPLTTLWLGYSNNMRLAVTALSAFLPIAILMMEGTRELPTTYLEVARSFHAKRLQIWAGVAIPAAMPFLVGGIQLAAGRAMVTGITSEMVAAIQGLGFFVIFEARSFHHNQAFVGVLVIALSGILLLWVIRRATAFLVPWYGPTRE
jgi:ABC-type nitrate/sulfonate/bicarbonate transport system permease component